MDVVTDWARLCGTSGVLLARSRLPAPWGMALGQSAEAMFHIILEGSCYLRTSDAQPLQLYQGDLVLVPQGIAHELVHQPKGKAQPLDELLARLPLPENGGPVTTVVCGAYRSDMNLAHPALRSLPPVVHFSAPRVRANPPLASVLALLTAELATPGPGNEALVRHLFDVLFVYLLRAWSEEAAPERPVWLTALRDEGLSRALSKIHTEPAAPWTVEGLAKAAGLSRAAFARRFSEHLGEAPLAYLTKWRMGQAARLLQTTEESVSSIANRVGYASEFAFSRAFKRSRGRAPSAFRRDAERRAPIGG